MNFTDGNMLKLTGLSDGENKAKHYCLVSDNFGTNGPGEGIPHT